MSAVNEKDRTIDDESDLNAEQRQALDDLVSYAVAIIEDEGGRTPEAHWTQDGRSHLVIDTITSTGGFDFTVEDDTITAPLRGVHPDLISEAIDDAL